jgi:excinuclease ABC subunit C
MAGKKVIYIGKASDLKNRLLSYVHTDDPRNQLIVTHATGLDLILTSSDTEALTLEESLIKLHKPRYNVRLKDDKKFPYLKITVQDRFPRIMFTRDIEPDGSLVFGPYTNARALRRTRDALCRIFKLVSCTEDLTKERTRPCLEHGLARCCAPCTRAISPQEYAELVKKAIAFLNGRSRELERRLEKLMWQYANQEYFEAAAPIRDQLIAIRRISQRQQIVTKASISRDVIGIHKYRNNCVACLLRIREQRLIAKEVFHMTLSPRVSDEEIASAFIRLIYTHLSFIPREIIVAHTPHDWRIQEKWFKKHKASVRLSNGSRGEPKRLLQWAERNAENELSKQIVKHRIPASLLDLQTTLELECPPRWIEAFDISNIGARYAVGSSVAFRDGKPYKQKYRRYRIKRTKGQNDFAMIHEIVKRRLKDLQKVSSRPDLLLIDGGPGQLSAALQAFDDLKTKAISVFALAKKHDELYNRDGKVVTVPQASRGMYLLRRIRNEAHRFAITYHRTIRKAGITASSLDTIPGIGRTRRIKLLQFFGSFDSLKKASHEDITRVPGIGQKTARMIYETLHS